MTQREFDEWCAAFIKASGLRVDESGFTDSWFPSLQGLDFRIALAAVSRLPSDPRVIKTPPRDRLPILLDLAADIQAEADRKNRAPVVWGDRPRPGELWDRRLLAMGVIDQDEYDRRRKA